MALRDLRFAKGRFALMGSVVLLITLLVTMLSGLTAGLARDSASAIENLPADRIVFGTADGETSFAESRIDQETLKGWQDVAGVTAEPFGISMNRIAFGASGEQGAPVALFGAAPGGGEETGNARHSLASGQIVLSAELSEGTGLKTGDSVQIAGHRFTVAGAGGASSYSHTPVAWIGLDDWRAIEPSGGGQVATVLLLRVTGHPGLDTADQRLGTTTIPQRDAKSAIPSFSAENGSLELMRGFLFAISALVIGAFFTVWTIQRRGDVAVLKALGASTGYLLRDALAQAVLVLLAGAGLGGAIGALAGLAIGDGVPFVVSAATTVLPMAVMIALGAVGAALAVRKITSVDPLTALGAAR
ncbi:FtsX-like permease family protein [Actinomadura darangshiensis]|uniref:FtsX-like permease family protein n=1 Tax=Actinomadura darangshiensis TaxID=705336 RepID=UPI00312C8D78